MQYEGSGWLSYDCHFCLNAAAQIMLSHKSEECALAVSQQKQGLQQTGKHIPYSQQHGSGMPNAGIGILPPLQVVPFKTANSFMLVSTVARTHPCLSNKYNTKGCFASGSHSSIQYPLSALDLTNWKYTGNGHKAR